MRPIAEFAVVFGLCVVVLFVVIPAGTAESDNFGLSPRMLPIATTAAIALFSVITLVSGLFPLRGRRGDQPVPTRGMLGVVLLSLAALAGVVLIDQAGLLIGGTALVLMASLAIGERRPLALLGMGLGAVAVLLLVDWSGL
ncbi:hypothetical protein GGD81_001099 [Rhodobium orientis]|uniref:DUF1468 domain-containing protein n=2 Tax=Rhodobium orientis TaxID=34017 RepID=A0A327JHS3_9HYPH|nr:tripartite tricarboxylate transporter TctB family protein [Rhodobium orientis]MBB4302075.1 hypothetical protein [Rhodobium orientis]MBK5951334.1 hypothetical protein [Rhodobium orientis]RAI25947.1 hypothetical protein CH339_16035 [Rhodobium orientis]